MRASYRSASALALLAGVAGSSIAGLAGVSLAGLAPAVAQTRPSNLADLVAQVKDAVVNISATQTIDDKTADAGPPDLPKGTPFDDMFEQFFKNHGMPGPQHEPPHAHRSSSLGSGFVIDASGIVITNNHVVGDANEIMVIFTDGRKLKAKVLGKDPKVDVAVLKVESDKPFKTVKFGDSDKVRVGEGVMAVGNPFGLGETVTAGILSARNRNIDSGPYDDFLQTDAAINKGNSGGPLFNMDGEVIGINTAILSPTGGSIGIGFATPASSVTPIITQLQSFGETRRGWLGVRIQPVDDSIAESLGLGDAHGALVAGVDPKGPARPAGVEAGDVIVAFDGKPIKESRDLPRMVASTSVGAKAEITLMRKGKEIKIDVTLGRLEDGEKQMAKTEATDDDSADTPKPTLPAKALGLTLSPLGDDERKTFKLKDSVKGVLVTGVDAGTPAADKGLRAGDVIEEVNQQAVEKPADVASAIDGLKKQGKKTALLLVGNGAGDVRFIALSLN